MLGVMNIRVSLSNLQADVGNQIVFSMERGEYAWDMVAWNVGIYLGMPLRCGFPASGRPSPRYQGLSMRPK